MLAGAAVRALLRAQTTAANAHWAGRVAITEKTAVRTLWRAQTGGAGAGAGAPGSADEGYECGVFTSRFDIDEESAAVLRWSLADESLPPSTPVGETDLSEGAVAVLGQRHDRDRTSEYAGTVR